MRKSSFEDTFDTFFYWIGWYTDLLVRVTEAKRVVAHPHEKKEIFEAFILKIHVTWDLLVEELMVDCLNWDTLQYAKYKGISLPKNLTRDNCACLITGLRFFDVRSTSEIKRIAKNILVPKYNPFKVLSKTDPDIKRDVKKIDEFYAMRNYIAHYSDMSRRRLMIMYKKSYGLRKFREPGDFLFAFDKQTKQIRFANYIYSFLNIADEMAIFLGVY